MPLQIVRFKQDIQQIRLYDFQWSKLLKKFNRIYALKNILSAQITENYIFFQNDIWNKYTYNNSKNECKSEEYAGERRIYQRNNIMLTWIKLQYNLLWIMRCNKIVWKKIILAISFILEYKTCKEVFKFLQT